ncbi:NfeD family protein [Streptomyces roseolus]|uniref:NfeD family protein n=1 Tax=Streptomyces roseolus TaxID=67358 RepID=UPI00167234D0|nr:NfeD family protein [Streptomyces roseolus]GGR63017.1 membrane protein [Streptomyces roseolus]
MELWLIWLILAGLLAVAEIFTLTAALGILGVAAAATAGAAALGLAPPLQLVVFTVLAAAGLFLVRPVAVRHPGRPPAERFGVDALVGRPARVVSEVTGAGGRIRLGGEEWTARAYDETLVIPPGATVDVMEIDGATAVVHPRE